MSIGLLFPGQGSQQVGMGKDLAESFPVAMDTFQEADDVLGFALSRLAWEGPEEELTATENAQPALFVHSLATFRILEEALSPVAAAAGHSLGELTAHGAAGTYSFRDGLRLVRRRGELMARAGKTSPGTMAAVIGLDEVAVAELCDRVQAEGLVVVPANLNTETQIVVSGEAAGVERLGEIAQEAGAKRVLPLKVSAAFHSPLMGPAVAEFRAQLEATELRAPAFPVLSNVTAEVASEPAGIRELLVRQLTSPVRWTACVSRMMELEVREFAELGPGSVLKGLNKRIAGGVPTTALGTKEAIESMESDR